MQKEWDNGMRIEDKRLRKLLKKGGKRHLNCIAELDPAAVAQIGCEGGLPLSGIPVLVKDNIDVKGLHTTAGSLALADNIAREDAPIIRNLRRNGAVVLGKTNMTEFANFTTKDMPGGYSSRGGRVIHAVSRRLSPAGSSSGSAVAVAAGIVPMAVGTDTSHSITACALFNGICGLKPPVGALPAEGIIPIARTLDSAGAMARNLADALKLYSAMRDEPLPELKPAGIDGLRIAVNRANREGFPEDQARFLDSLPEKLKAGGAVIGEVDQGAAPEMMTIMQWEFRPMLEEYLAKSAASRKTLAEIVEYYESHPRKMMKYGDTLLRAALDETPGGLEGRPYLDALEARREAIEKVTAEIWEYDAVLMTGPTSIMHFCGLPSVTVASGDKDKHGVQRCLILYGADELKLYSAALAIERMINTPPGK